MLAVRAELTVTVVVATPEQPALVVTVTE